MRSATLPDGRVVSYLLDGLGRRVVHVATGTVLQELDYDPFGQVLRDTAPGTTLFGYAGGLYDSDTKLSHFGAREYDPETGLWTSKDPLLFGGGDTNVYAYAFGDPVDFVDPDGRFVFIAAAIVGVVALGVWNYHNADDQHGGSITGKANAATTTGVGLAYGGSQVLLGDAQFMGVGNNAVQFSNVNIPGSTGAVTLGNVICYRSQSPSATTQNHERQHTYQAEVLGYFYLPPHAMSQALSAIAFIATHPLCANVV
ncbi:MAG: RHS repeat-associated core domain-containing protein [Deltaproteobacteria bacterium]|nr:RHS repeat-associated core domain-containing protein [Deltaproteobacteria bacterium]